MRSADPSLLFFLFNASLKDGTQDIQRVQSS